MIDVKDGELIGGIDGHGWTGGPGDRAKAAPVGQMTVRPLRADEIELVLPIGKAFGKEAGVAWEPSFFLRFWRNMYEMGMGTIFGLFDDPMADYPWPAVLAGSLGALITPDMFSGKLAASEAWWYVYPEFRNGHGLLLLDAYEEWAKTVGAKIIDMANLEALDPEKVEAIYLKRGYRKIGSNYRKEI